MDVKHQATFEKAKLRRILEREGVPFIFRREKVNKFKEPSDKTEIVVELKGVYHESTGYVKTETSDGGIVRKKPQPMILTEWEKAAALQVDDFTVIDGKRYSVTGVKDVKKLGVYGDISLEVSVTDGTGI